MSNSSPFFIDSKVNYAIPPQPLISAIEEAQSFIYRRYFDDLGRTWLVKDGKYAGDNIYVGKERDRFSQGFAGQTIEFELTSHERVRLEGPYLTSSDALHSNTGVDMRQRHKNFVVISLGKIIKDAQTVLTDIVYKDPCIMESRLSRGKELAADYARTLKKPVYVYIEMVGKTSILRIN